MSSLGSAGLFAALAGVNMLQLVFACFCMPETRGLTLEEVQMKYFNTANVREGKALKQTPQSDVFQGEEGTIDDSRAVKANYKTFAGNEVTKNDHMIDNQTGSKER